MNSRIRSLLLRWGPWSVLSCRAFTRRSLLRAAVAVTSPRMLSEWVQSDHREWNNYILRAHAQFIHTVAHLHTTDVVALLIRRITHCNNAVACGLLKSVSHDCINDPRFSKVFAKRRVMHRQSLVVRHLLHTIYMYLTWEEWVKYDDVFMISGRYFHFLSLW